MRRKYRKNTAE